MTDAVARVHEELLSEHHGEVIRMVGKVVDDRSDPVTLRTTDGATVPIRPARGRNPARFTADAWVEIRGRLQADNSIVEDFTIPMPGELYPDALNQMVTLMAQHSEIFA
jgi:hypothetical protein